MSDPLRPFHDRPARVLLVEDSPDQAYLTSTMLQQAGPVDVTVVQDGLRALEVVAENAFDLVVTDLNLPGLDGFQFTERLKKSRPDLPVLAVTGYTDPAHSQGAIRAGAEAVLIKPVEPETLAAKLAQIFPAPDDEAEGPPTVMAIGVRSGDLALGCAGSLAAHADAGHRTVVLLLLAAAAGDEAEREASAMVELGAARVERASSRSQAEILVAEVTRSERPRLVYLPSPRDEQADRRDLFDRVVGSLPASTAVYAYPTVTSTLDFRPGTYRDIGARLDRKLAAVMGDDAAHADFVRAHALYWGRFAGYASVEPFEILRGGSA